MKAMIDFLDRDRGGKAILAAALLVLFSIFALRHGWWLAPFWDNGVYARAAVEQLAGADPYRIEPFPFFPFVYHPYVLILFSGLQAHVSLWHLLLVPLFGTAGFAGAQLFKAAGVKVEPFAASLCVTACFVMFGLTTFASGNLIGTLDFLVIGLGLVSLARGGRYFTVPMFMVVVIGAVVKPYFLAYLGLCLLDRRPIWQGLGILVGGTALAIMLWFSGYWVTPDLMGRYVQNIQDLQSPTRMDLGFTVFSLAQYLMPNSAALGVHLLVTGGGAIIALPRLWQASARGVPAAFVFAIAWLLLTLLNPRMKDYDIGPALLFLAPFLWTRYRSYRIGMTGFMIALWCPMAIVIVAAMAGIRL